MTGAELHAWRQAATMSRPALAALIGVTDKTIQRAEALGAADVSEKIAKGIAALDAGEPVEVEPPKPPKVETGKAGEIIEAHRLPRPYDFKNAPAFVAGCARFPVSNDEFKADRYHDTRPASPGWQRVPGCIQIVNERIPQPLPYEGPRWAGHLSIWAANGKVYDIQTGREIKPRVSTGRPVQAPRVAFQKEPKKAKAR